jgi:hypothetical protein
MNFILIAQTFISLFQTITSIMPAGSTVHDRCEATLVGLTGVVGDVTAIAPTLRTFATTIESALATVESGGPINYLSLIGTTMNLVKDIEELMPASAGKDKLNVVIATLTALYGDVSAMAPGLTSLITVAVKGLRAAGVFKSPVPVAVPVQTSAQVQ